MKMLYLDELVIMETIADGILLWSAGKLCGCRQKLLRILPAAVLGAAYAVLTLFWKPASGMWMKSASLILMLLLAYGGEKRFARVILSFLAMSALYAGVSEAVYIAAGRTTVRALLFALGMSMGICALPFRSGEKHSGICKILISRNHAKVELTALRDTGHNLREPISGEPVVLSAASEFLPLLTKEQQNLLISTENLPAEQRLVHMGGGFRLIPYHSVSDTGFLLGFRVQLQKEGEANTEMYWAGICDNAIRTETGCNALIGT